MMNFLLPLMMLKAALIGVCVFVYEVRDHISLRITKDTYLGDLADGIASRERNMVHINQALWALHTSCPEILLLPPPASATALESGRLLSQTLATSQNLLRAQNKAQLLAATLKGYSVQNSLATERLTSLCNFQGPIRQIDDGKVDIHDNHAGIKIEKLGSFAWRFSHAEAARAWF